VNHAIKQIPTVFPIRNGMKEGKESASFLQKKQKTFVKLAL
jgi:hypothetical protein